MKQIPTPTGMRAPCRVSYCRAFKRDRVATIVRSYLHAAARKTTIQTVRAQKVRAILVPHGPLARCGAIAAHGFAALARSQIDRPLIFLMGAAPEQVAHGVGLSTATDLATPLGSVAVATDQVARLLYRADPYRLADAVHTQEQSVQVQLPFLQMTQAHSRIVPMLWAQSGYPEWVAADLIDAMQCNPDARIVVSANLGYADPDGVGIDAALLAALVAGDVAAVEAGVSVDRLPILCLMHVASCLGWRAHLLAQADAGDGDSAHAGQKYIAVAYT